MHDCYCAFDNGISGQIAIIRKDFVDVFATPTKECFSYTKVAQKTRRIDVDKVLRILNLTDGFNTIVLLERPLVNPTRFKATQSAMRALEATLICLEMKNLSYIYQDSKCWQRDMLPEGLEGIELKKASLQMGKQLFSTIKWDEKKLDDADGLLLAEWARRKNL
jgi:hypothetical protein